MDRHARHFWIGAGIAVDRLGVAHIHSCGSRAPRHSTKTTSVFAFASIQKGWLIMEVANTHTLASPILLATIRYAIHSCSCGHTGYLSLYLPRQDFFEQEFESLNVLLNRAYFIAYRIHGHSLCVFFLRNRDSAHWNKISSAFFVCEMRPLQTIWWNRKWIEMQ